MVWMLVKKAAKLHLNVWKDHQSQLARCDSNNHKARFQPCRTLLGHRCRCRSTLASVASLGRWVRGEMSGQGGGAGLPHCPLWTPISKLRWGHLGQPGVEWKMMNSVLSVDRQNSPRESPAPGDFNGDPTDASYCWHRLLTAAPACHSVAFAIQQSPKTWVEMVTIKIFLLYPLFLRVFFAILLAFLPTEVNFMSSNYRFHLLKRSI